MSEARWPVLAKALKPIRQENLRNGRGDVSRGRRHFDVVPGSLRGDECRTRSILWRQAETKGQMKFPMPAHPAHPALDLIRNIIARKSDYF